MSGTGGSRLNRTSSRYFATAARMDAALVEILETKPFEYITVREICEKAGVNRSTFYLHYETTRDLLEETAKHLLDDFTSRFSVDVSSIAGGFSDRELAELNFISPEYLHPYLIYIRDNRHVFSTVLTHIGSFGFDQVYRRMFRHIFDPILSRFHYPESHRPYVMMFYLNGLTAVVTQWMKNDCETSIEDLTAIIRECVFGRPHPLHPRVQNADPGEEP